MSDENKEVLRQETPMLNLHQILQKAQLENFGESEEKYTKQLNTRVNQEKHDLSTGICERHGVTLSDFIRGCMDRLVEEYTK